MEHAPAWIQGVAAVVQAAVAVLLWRVTTKYVRLTHHLSQTAENQLALLRETELHRRRADLIDLASLARRLLKSLEELPAAKTDQGASDGLLFASLWTPEELGQLRVLAAKAGADYAEKAEQPAVDLNWMLERIYPVRTEQRGQGFEMASFHWDDHAMRIQRAKTALAEIADTAFKTAKALGMTIPQSILVRVDSVIE